MPQQRSAPMLEMRAIKTMTDGSLKLRSKLLGMLNRDCFAYPPAQEAYLRVVTLARERGTTMDWEEVLHDSVISEDSRTVLQQYDKDALTTNEQVQRLSALLHRYRSIRILYNTSAATIRAFKGEDSIDVSKLLDEHSKAVTSARTGERVEDWFVRIGAKDETSRKNAVETLRRVLDPDGDQYIPTGFRAFDDVSYGIPRGSAWVLAGTTGGGKSALANQVKYNMVSKFGARCCTIPLEMSQDEQMQRRLANLAQYDLQRMINVKEMSRNDRRSLIDCFRQWRARLEKIGAADEDFVPEVSMTVEEILFLLKTYNYDMIIIDYLGLAKGMNDEKFWMNLGDAVGFTKRYAAQPSNNNIILSCAQLSEEGLLRYSKMMAENASYLWSWVYDEVAQETGIVEINQDKARMRQRFRFQLYFDLKTMTVRDLTKAELCDYTEDIEDKKKPKKANGKLDDTDDSPPQRRGRGGKPRAKADVGIDDDYYHID